MKFWQYVVLFTLSLAVYSVAAIFQRVPGYMDADYYYATGRQIAVGKGFTENFLWNYLDDPVKLPHPSHTYWMPLPSLMSASGMILFQSTEFIFSRLPFLILACFLAPFTAFSYTMLAKKVQGAFLAGLFAVFSGFYVIYQSLPETFLPMQILGLGFILVAFSYSAFFRSKNGIYKYFFLGLISGLIHLTRADGITWLAASLILCFIDFVTSAKAMRKLNVRLFLNSAVNIGSVLIAYLIVMMPWYLRNLEIYHSIFPPGSSKTLWLTSYNETFIYPSSLLSFDRWIDSGIVALLTVRITSFIANLKTALAVQGQIYLLPLIVLGFWDLRKESYVKLTLIFWLFIFLFMSIVFPFAGARGGFLHSGSAFQPVFWISASHGFQKMGEWGCRKRGWKKRDASLILGSGLVAISMCMTGWLFYSRVISSTKQYPQWETTWRQYQHVDAYLSQMESASEIVMVNNPPGYVAATGKPAVVIPFADIDTIWLVAQKFGASYLIIDANYVPALENLYRYPQDVEGFEYQGKTDEMVVYQVLSR